MAYNYFNQQSNQFQSHLFPQPNGNVYTINSSSELSNIPVGIGLTVVLCMAENTLYLKSIQNGNPVVWSYRISSNDKSSEDAAAIQEPTLSPQSADLTQMEKRIAKLEKKWEGMFNEQLKS